MKAARRDGKSGFGFWTESSHPQDICTSRAGWNFSVSVACLAIFPRLRMDIWAMDIIALLHKKTFEEDQQAFDSR